MDNDTYREAEVVNGWAENKKWVLTELDRLNRKAESIDSKLNDIKAIHLPEVKEEIRNHVISSMKEISAKIEEIQEKHIVAIREDIVVLKLKSGLWGGLAGIVTALSALIVSGKLFS